MGTGDAAVDLAALQAAVGGSPAWWSALFDAAGFGLSITTTDGRFLASNRALQRMLGYDPESLAEVSVAGILHPDDVEEDAAHFRRLLAGEIDRYQMESRLQRRDGATVWTTVTVVLIREQDAEPVVAAIVEDVTERRLADEARDRFIADAAHELRTPVGTIGGLVELLLEDSDSDEERELLAMLQRQTERLTDLTSALLDLSRIERGMLQIPASPVELDEVVQRACGTAPAPSDRTLDCDVPSLTVLGDSGRLEQVLVNLLTNAYRHGAGAVRVTAREVGGAAEISVTDEGPGVPDELADELFEPFRRRGGEGSGLGLAISRGIIEALGGELRYERGEGATFVVRLPLAR